MNRVKVADIASEMEYAVNALAAVHVAMAEGPYNPKEFVDALYFVTSRLEDMVNELNREALNRDE